MFEESRKKKNVRKGFVTKHNTLYYRVRPRKKELQLLLFWDNRQDPEDLALQGIPSTHNKISTSPFSQVLYGVNIDALIIKLYKTAASGCRNQLDMDLTELYDVETRILKQAVRRNRDRFPDDFIYLAVKPFHFREWI